MNAGDGDPVEAALDRAAAGLDPDDRATVVDLLRAGLAELGPGLDSADLAIEIDAATAVPVERRLDAARRFAAVHVVRRLLRNSFELVRAFRRGDDVDDVARALLAEIETVLARDDLDDELRLDLADGALECRYVLSGGTGPVSLRARKAT